MTAALGEQVTRLADSVQSSQNAVEVQAIYKGGYADVLNATIAASRAGQAPHIAQIFEVGTGTMLAAGKAVKQVWELAKETGVHDRPEDLHPVGARLLQPGGRTHGVDAVQFLHRGDVVQQGCVPQGRARSGQAAGNLGRGASRQRRRSRAKNAAEIPSTSAWLELDPVGAIQRPAQHPVRQQGRRVRGPGRRARNQQQAACQAHGAPARHGEGGHVQIHRPRQRRPTSCWCPARPASISIPPGCAATW